MKLLKFLLASLLILGLFQLTRQQQLNEDENRIDRDDVDDDEIKPIQKTITNKINLEEESSELTTTTTTTKPTKSGYRKWNNKSHLNKWRERDERRRQERVDEDEEDGDDADLFKPHRCNYKKHGKKCGHFNHKQQNERQFWPKKQKKGDLDRELHKELRDVKREQKKIDRLIQQENKIREMRVRTEKRLSDRLKLKGGDLLKAPEHQQQLSSDNYKAKSNDDEILI